MIDKPPRRTPRQRAAFIRRAAKVKRRLTQRWGYRFRRDARDRRRIREVMAFYRETGSWSAAAAKSILMMMRGA